MREASIGLFEQVGTPIKITKTTIPSLQPGEILIKNEYVTLCRSDIYTYCGKRKEKTPTILGHEIVGKVLDHCSANPIYDAQKRLVNLGDRISWAIYASDPKNSLAHIGIPQKSSDLFKYGHERVTNNSTLHGGLATHTIIRPFTPLMKLSDDLPISIAALINCSIATVAGSCRLSGIIKDKNVLIIGAGMLGVVACAMCKTLQASTITALDVLESRLKIATRFGADHTHMSNDNIDAQVLNSFNNLRPFDIILDFSGVTRTIERAFDWLNIGGVFVLVGSTFPQDNIQINAEKVVRNIWTIRGLHNYNEMDFIQAVQFIEDNHDRFPFKQLIDDRFSLEEADHAFQYALEHNPYRVGIHLE